MASKSNAALTAETPAAPQFVFDNISLNFAVSGRDLSTGENVGFSFNDNTSLDLNNIPRLNQEIRAKAWLLDVIPALVNVAIQSYDPENQEAKALKDSIAALLG